MDEVAFFSYANYDIGQFITFWKRFKQNIFLFLDCYRYLFISRQFLIPNLEAAFYLEISGNEWKAALNQHSRETNEKLFFDKLQLPSYSKTYILFSGLTS